MTSAGSVGRRDIPPARLVPASGRTARSPGADDATRTMAGNTRRCSRRRRRIRRRGLRRERARHSSADPRLLLPIEASVWTDGRALFPSFPLRVWHWLSWQGKHTAQTAEWTIRILRAKQKLRESAQLAPVDLARVSNSTGAGCFSGRICSTITSPPARYNL